MIKRLDHVGIVVDDLATAKRFLSETLGLQLIRELDVPALARRVAFFQCGDASIEVIEDLHMESRARVLNGATARIEHVALEVDNVEGELASLSGLGVKADGRGVVSVGARLNAWTDPLTTDGVMYQLLSPVGDPQE
jgi:methylmalonyl-CoA/ethylmalonyl-CoA epimerase